MQSTHRRRWALLADRTANAAVRRAVLCVAAFAVMHVATARAGNPAPAPHDGQKPNIILIMADDLGYGGLGCYGQQLAATPNLDRMASEGLRFTQAYAGGSVCAPSRCVLMTGLHVGHARVRGNGEASNPGLSLLAGDVCLAEVMKDAGYVTGLIGKWGLGDVKNAQPGLPRRQGFDYFFGYLRHGHAHNYYPSFLWRNESKVQLSNGPTQNPAADRGISSKKVQYSHDLFAADALDFVREHRSERFFLYLALTIPHANNEAGDQGMEVPDYGKYADRDWTDPQKGYAAMVSRMDGDIGRLLALIDELGIDEQTLVIFTSDNGPPGGEGGFTPDFFDANGPLRGYKGHLTEGGIRVPLIARWPGRIPAGALSEAPIYFADVMPTFAALGGGKAPEGIDGLDFTAALLGSDQLELSDRFFYWEFDKIGLQQQAARWKHWKAIRDPKTASIEIYDLAADVGETHDLAAAHPEIVAKFAEYFRTARTDSPYWPVTATEAKDSEAGGEARVPSS